MFCERCGKEQPEGAAFCDACGAPLPTGIPPPPPPPEGGSDAMRTIIPTGNPKALVAYYLGVFSAIPCIGAPLGLVGLILGILGLKYARANPGAKGKVHAWIGILAGGFFFLLWTVLGVAALSARK